MRNLDKRLYRTCWLDDVINALDAHDLPAPDQGGCLVIAEALRLACGHGRLVGVFGHTLSYAALPVCQHVVLQIGAFYLDAQGVHSRHELLGMMLDDWQVVTSALDPLELPAAEFEEGNPDWYYHEPLVWQLVAIFREHYIDTEICTTFGLAHPATPVVAP